ncbi:Hypothetical protein A7982_13751 [Minicystis rosea]|nr:Hypothetical protein A7982_13751 [Minicystis rosea]
MEIIMKTTRTLGVIGAILSLSAIASAASDPKAGGGGVSQVDTFNGSLTHAIPIQVPAFHGIEPKLSIGYNSAGGNGWLGVGWNLRGISVIERTNPNGGAPRYDDAVDGFRLDGVALVPCQPGSKSPSCLTGGTHSTKIESWQRITRDAVHDTWTVWERNGTRMTYAPVYWAGSNLVSPTYEWGLVEVRDTHDNVVNYTWGANLGNTCCWVYPQSISYNQTTVRLDWALRPDVETRAIGNGVSSLHGRLAAIEVLTSGQPVRAYTLRYGAATSTMAGGAGRSLLTAVQTHGSDYQLDSAFQPIGGTALPAETYQYADAPASDYAAWSQPNAGLGVEPTNPGAFQSGDLDGDGRADIFHVVQDKIFVHRGNADGSLQPAVSFPVRTDQGDHTNTGQILVVDLDGDGKSDLVHLDGWSSPAYLNNGSGFDYVTGFYQSAHNGTWSNKTTLQTMPMDLDGNGTTDLVNLDSQGASFDPAQASVNRVTWFAYRGGSFHAAELALPASYPLTKNGVTVGRFVAGDLDGDGYTDLVYITGGSVTVLLNNGRGAPPGFTARPAQSGSIATNPSQSTVLTGDFNGDGKTDLLYVPLQFAPVPLTTWLSTGSGGFSISAPSTLTPIYGTSKNDRFYVTDVNGDGKADVVHVLAGVIYTWISKGDGQFTLAMKNALDNTDNLDATTVGDVNGDGKGDLVFLSLRNLVSLTATGSAGNLMTQMSNGLGATYAYTYAPSSSYPGGATTSSFTSTNPGTVLGTGTVAMPNTGIVQTVQRITAADAFGNTSVTKYAYSGALYDPIERSSLGFRWVRQELPWNEGESFGPIVETYYHQSYGFVSRPEWELRYDGKTGVLLHADYHHHRSGTTDGSGNAALPPYTQVEADTWHWDYDPSGNGAYRATAAQRALDGWGNVQDALDWGEVTPGAANLGAPPASLVASGDERRSWMSYALDTTAFITSLPSGTETYAGVSYAGSPIAATSYRYDRRPDGQALPSGQVQKGDLTGIARWLDTSDTWTWSARAYDAAGNLVQSSEMLDGTPTYTSTTIAYDPNDHVSPIATTNALGHTTTITYDAICQAPVAVTDANGHATTITYDALCRPTTKGSTDGGAITTLEYPALADYGTAAEHTTTTTRAPDGTLLAVSAEYHDGFGRVRTTVEGASAIGAGGRRKDTTYTARGQVASATAPYFDVAGATPSRETFTHDTLDRVIRVTHADGTAGTISYPAWGTISVDELGHRVATYKDAHGNEVRREESLGSDLIVTTRSYDALGHLAAITDTTGLNVATFETDSLGRVHHSVDPDLGDRSFAFNLAGWEISRTDARGEVTATSYDALGRIVAQGDRTFTYDEPGHGASIGRVTTAADASGDSIAYTYDAIGRTTRMDHTIAGADYVVQRAYDAAGRVVGTRYPDGSTVGCDPAAGCAGASIAYDLGGRVQSIPGIVTGATYTAAGQPSVFQLANGAVTSHSYDPRRAWLTGIVTSGVATPVIQDLAIGRDARGLVTSVASAQGAYPAWSWTYTLDELGRLTGATSAARSQSFVYDATGNLTSVGTTITDAQEHVLSSAVTSYTYPAAGAARPHAVTGTTTTSIGYGPSGTSAPASTSGSVSYAYDLDGNMTSGAGRTLSWDAQSRPTTITQGGLVTSLFYGPSGERVRKVSAGSTTTYVGDGFQVTQDANGTTFTTIIAIGDRPVAQRVRVAPIGGGNTKTATTWLHTDHLASVVAQSDTGGKVVSRAAYAPYGAPIEGGVSSPIGYTGERRDAETGLVYLHHRYYDPALGRFISADPLVGPNRYAYADNNPVSANDRNGLYATDGDGNRIPHTIQELMAVLHHEAVRNADAKKAYGRVKALYDNKAGVPAFQQRGARERYMFLAGLGAAYTSESGIPVDSPIGGDTWVNGKSSRPTCPTMACPKDKYPSCYDQSGNLKCSVHTGPDQYAVDFSAPTGTDVHPSLIGQVVYIGKSSKGYGNVVVVRSGAGIITVYAHLDGVSAGVDVGDWVTPDTVLGQSGSTGNSSGPHLHFSMRQGVSDTTKDASTLLYTGTSVCLPWSGACSP